MFGSWCQERASDYGLCLCFLVKVFTGKRGGKGVGKGLVRLIICSLT